MIEKLRMNLEELEKTIKLLEIQLAKVKVKYAVGEISEEAYRKKNETLELGLLLLKNESKKMKEMLEGAIPSEARFPKDKIRMILEELPIDKAFYFYTDYDQYTGKYARNLKEFVEAVKDIETRSLRFHLTRGDFQSWIRDLGHPELALILDGLKKLGFNDEELRNGIHECVKKRIELLERILETL